MQCIFGESGDKKYHKIQKILQVSWTAKVTNVAVWERLHEKPEFLQNIKARKLGYFGHIMRQESLSIENAVISGLVPGNRSRGRPAMVWINNIVEWTGMGGTMSLC